VPKEIFSNEQVGICETMSKYMGFKIPLMFHFYISIFINGNHADFEEKIWYDFSWQYHEVLLNDSYMRNVWNSFKTQSRLRY
jgi:hypothetical protein